MNKPVKTAAWIFIFLTGALAGISLLIIDHTIDSFFNPVAIPNNKPATMPKDLNGKNLKLKYRNFSLDAWYFEVKNAEFAVLICHDATGNIYSRTPLYRLFRQLGVSVFTMDYRGFGRSGGEEPAMEDYAIDMKRGYERIRQMMRHQEKLILYGQGIFASDLLNLAADRHCDGVILENAVPALQRVFRDPIRSFLLKDRFNLEIPLKKLSCPALFIHGAGNSTVSTGVIQDLISDAGSFNRFCPIDGAGNEEIAGSRPDQWKRCVMEFLAEVRKSADAKKAR